MSALNIPTRARGLTSRYFFAFWKVNSSRCWRISCFPPTRPASADRSTVLPAPVGATAKVSPCFFSAATALETICSWYGRKIIFLPRPSGNGGRGRSGCRRTGGLLLRTPPGAGGRLRLAVLLHIRRDHRMDTVLVGILPGLVLLDAELGNERQPAKILPAVDAARGLCGLSHIVGTNAPCTFQNGAQSSPRDVAGCGFAAFIQLAAGNDQKLPNLPLGVRTLGNDEFAVQHQRVGRLRLLEPASIAGATGPDAHGQRDDGARGDRVETRRLPVGAVEIVAHDLSFQIIGVRRNSLAFAPVDFLHQPAKVRLFDHVQFAGPVSGRIVPRVGPGTDKRPVRRPVVRPQFGHGDDLIHNAGEFQSGLGSLNLRFEKLTVEVVPFGVQQAYEPDVAPTDILKLRHPTDHLLSEQSVRPAGIRLSRLLAESFRLARCPLETQPRGHGDGVDEESPVFFRRGGIAILPKHIIVMSLAIRLVRTHGGVWPAEKTGHVPGRLPVPDLERVAAPAPYGQPARLKVEEQRRLRVKRPQKGSLADLRRAEDDALDAALLLHPLIGGNDAKTVHGCPPAFADDTGVAHRSGRSKWRLMPSPRSYLTASSAEMARVPLQCRHTVA
uniref:Uncharacterized protein n=1 Tax=Siphoviridae sp. ct3yx7 TaxID=2825326 RepID=A0A8S5P585_9CAUD|nr:MAG TPA: hypothetical protein [Siphoviridae sp. ct3yx7]